MRLQRLPPPPTDLLRVWCDLYEGVLPGVLRVEVLRRSRGLRRYRVTVGAGPSSIVHVVTLQADGTSKTQIVAKPRPIPTEE